MNLKRVTVLFLASAIAFSSLALSFSLAWYSQGRNLEVDNLIMRVETETDLLISPSGEEGTFVDSLTRENLNQVAAFIPVTSMDSASWINTSDQPVFYDCTNSLVPSSGNPFVDVANYGFFRQTLYLYSNRSVTVSVDGESSFLEANEEANAAYAKTLAAQFPSKTEETYLEELNSLEKAMRISLFVPNQRTYSIIDPCKEGDTYYGGILDNSKNRYYDSYGKDGERYEAVYGSVNDRSLILYDAPSHGDIMTEGEYTAFNANHQAGVHLYDPEASAANGFQIEKENACSWLDLEKPFRQNPVEIPLNAYTPTPVVVSIYLEGWDRESVNSTMGGNFTAQLDFKIIGGNL